MILALGELIQFKISFFRKMENIPVECSFVTFLAFPQMQKIREPHTILHITRRHDINHSLFGVPP